MNEVSAARGRRERLRPLTGAQRQPQFLLDRFVHFVEVQRGLALVAEHFQHLRPLFLRHLDSGILEVDDMHLQRLHEKILIVPTTGTGQRHSGLLFRRQ